MEYRVTAIKIHPQTAEQAHGFRDKKEKICKAMLHTVFRSKAVLQSNKENSCKSMLGKKKNNSLSRAQTEEEKSINISIMLVIAQRKKPWHQHTIPNVGLGASDHAVSVPELQN